VINYNRSENLKTSLVNTSDHVDIHSTVFQEKMNPHY